jgi:hypothetical protein
MTPIRLSPASALAEVRTASAKRASGDCARNEFKILSPNFPFAY